MLIAHNCVITGKPYAVIVTEAEYFRWKVDLVNAQDAFPDLSPGDREFILTGISPEGWNSLFPTEIEQFPSEIEGEDVNN